MKRNLLSCLALLLCISAYSQKIIDNPEYRLSNIPGSITKIELTDTATVLHFYIKATPGVTISVPKQSFIQPINGEEKLYVIKAEGTSINEMHIVPDSGEVRYKLYFPKIDNSVSKIDFGESNDGGNWDIYDIVINRQVEKSMMPKELLGDWKTVDGSNTWKYGFYSSKAIVEKAVWTYKSVETKGKKHTIILERNGVVKTIYAKINKNELAKIGDNPKNLKNYSLKETHNANYKFENDIPFFLPIFKLDSATYSGVIKGFTPRAGKKTGMIYVNNLLTGKQDSHLVKVADDGSFTVKFLITNPQTIYVRLPFSNTSVFVEPGKETFHLINSKVENSLFMGDCAQINSGLIAMQSIRSFDMNNARKTILETSSKEHKESCFEARDKDLEAVSELEKKQFICQKALQIKKLDIQYATYTNIISYGMFRDMAIRRNTQQLSYEEIEVAKNYKIEESYYNFISKPVINDELAIITSGYSSFINYLKYAKVFRGSNEFKKATVEIVELLKKSSVDLTDEELTMAEASKEIQTVELMQRKSDFQKKYGDDTMSFVRKHYETYMKMEKKEENRDLIYESLFVHLKENGAELTAKDIELYTAFKAVETEEEVKRESVFNEKYGSILKDFNAKHKDFVNNLRKENFINYRNNKMREVFGVSESFVFDIMNLQDICTRVENDFNPYSNEELKAVQGTVQNQFLSDYIVVVNDKTKAKIEANKSKNGYTVHQTVKTEGDQLFESMMAKFKGKVVYVDFWATWCGPCLSGIRKIAPLKEEMKNDNVVFVYITNQSSPENTWKNSIPDIKGEHFRVSTDEWNYLSSKFNITGIPHYTLVNKKGEVVNPRLGHLDNENLKRILEEQITTDLKEFKIIIEKTENGIKMQSTEGGTSWIDLSFGIKNGKPQAIDEYGMTSLDNVSSKKGSNLADFLFTITKTEKGIVLKGIEGTVWTDLSFSLAEKGKQAIDRFGMTALN